MGIELYQYASQIKATTGYFIVYQDKNLIISTSKTDPDFTISLMVRTKETNYLKEIKHIRINKESFNQAIEKEREI